MLRKLAQYLEFADRADAQALATTRFDLRREKSRPGPDHLPVPGTSLGPAVLQAGDPVEHRLAGTVIETVGHEVAVALELHPLVGADGGQ
jgi:hypothetical protein